MRISQETVDEILSRAEGWVHNARLVEASTGQDAQAIFEIDGVQVRAPVATDLSRWIGQIGLFYAALSTDIRAAIKMRFNPYPDQSLRRRPEFDGGLRAGAGFLGWSCESRGIFLAPPSIIPGENGRFVPDTTVKLDLDIPPEFEEVCSAVGKSPAELLRGFIADAAGIRNSVATPRADRFNSNGSDERDMAESYIERAWGHLREQADRNRRFREEAEAKGAAMDDAIDEIQDLADEHGVDPADLPGILRRFLAGTGQER